MCKDIVIVAPLTGIKKDNFSPLLKNIAINGAGYYYKAFDHQIERTGINDCIIIYCLDGQGWLKHNGITSTVSKGTLIFCDKNTHHGYGSKPENPWTILWAHFHGTYTDIFSNELLANGKCISIDIGYQPRIVEYLEELIKSLEKGLTTINLMQATSYLELVLCAIIEFKQLEDTRTAINNEYISSAIKYMNENLYNNIALDNMSSHIGLSKYHFSRLFKKLTKYSPIEYFNRLKIQKACDILTTTDLTISEISEMLSYNTPYYFSEHFKQVTGFSPSQFRQIVNTRV